MRTIGLSIQDAVAELSGLTRGFAGPKALFYHQVELPQEPSARTSRLRETLLEYKKKFSLKAVVVGLPLEAFLHYMLHLPPMKPQEVRQALSFELEKYLPLPAEEYAWDFHVLERTPRGLQVLVLALRHQGWSWLQDALKDTGLRPLGLRCTFLETLGLLLRRRRLHTGAVLCQGPSRVYVAEFHLGRLQKLRLLAPEQAKAEIGALRQRGLAIWSIGGELEGAQPLALSPAYAVASSGIGPLRRPLGMDLSFGTLRPVKKDYYTVALWSMAALAVALYLLSPSLAYYKDYRALQQVRAERKELERTARELLQIQDELEDIRAQKAFILGFQERMNLPTRALSELSRLLPQEAWLMSLRIDASGKVELKGFARQSALLIEPLERSPLFRKVQFSTPVVTREGLERFSIKMELEQ